MIKTKSSVKLVRSSKTVEESDLRLFKPRSSDKKIVKMRNREKIKKERIEREERPENNPESRELR